MPVISDGMECGQKETPPCGGVGPTSKTLGMLYNYLMQNIAISRRQVVGGFRKGTTSHTINDMGSAGICQHSADLIVNCPLPEKCFKVAFAGGEP
jgi:hypothetical protein